MPSDAPDYFLEIESHFANVRKTPFVFSAKDWALMKSWYESGIPLSVVIEAIDTCFQKRSEGGRKRMVSSLSYCRHAVEEIWSERKDLQVGKNDSVPEQNAAAQLDELAGSLRAAAKEARRAEPLIAAAADRVDAIGRAQSVPHIEEELMKIEEELFGALSVVLDDEERKLLDDAVNRQLKSAGNVDEKTLARTRRANERRWLRTRFGIPRLSLFG